MHLHLPQRMLRWVLLAVCGLVIAGGTLAALWLAAVGTGRAPVAAFFSLSFEDNLPTWFASVLLFSCAVLLGLAALGARRNGDPYQRHWWGLAIGFCYLSLDEALQLHELTNRWFDLHGIFYFGWVIPVGIVVAVLGLCYLRFVRHLPRQSRYDFLCAGAVYVGGALGVELVLGYWTDAYGADTLGYALIDLVEESMEILGAALFLCALVRHLAGNDGVLQIELGSPDALEESSRAPVAGAGLAPRAAGRSAGPVGPRNRVTGRGL